MSRLIEKTALLVIGAGPYGLSAAARAIERGIDTTVVGHPMGFWRDHMPARMLLRSGPDWHLDAAGVHTFEAYLEERRIAPDTVDPIPVALFLEYTDWFCERRRVRVQPRMVETLTRPNESYEAVLVGGDRIVAEAVVAAPGIASFQNLPAWADRLPTGIAQHTCDAIRFDDLMGARVLIVGGRQSAYEWAALIAEQGARRIDVVHRHDEPSFERISWRFADAYVENTLRHRGWWRRLSKSDQEAITRRFWEAGRLTLEYWLAPRLARENVHRRARTEVVEVIPAGRPEEATVRLSDGERLTVDRVIFASGYRVDLTKVPYLAGLCDRLSIADGFPVLGESFDASLPGLYLPGFVATRDFGPFLGFVLGSAAAATIIVDDLLRRP